jgi:hypothetical protein
VMSEKITPDMIKTPLKTATGVLFVLG